MKAVRSLIFAGLMLFMGRSRTGMAIYHQDSLGNCRNPGQLQAQTFGFELCVNELANM